MPKKKVAKKTKTNGNNGTSKRGEFKGNPMIILAKDAKERYPFQFGLRKAAMVLANIPAIEAFVADHPAEG